MAPPVSPDPSYVYPSQSHHEEQNMFELEWEMAVLGAYLAAAQKNSPLGAHLSTLNNALGEGKMTPVQSASELNQLISQINFHSGKGVEQLPSFEFTTKNASAALNCFSKTLEKLVDQLTANNPLSTSLSRESKSLFEAITSGLYDNRPIEAIQKLNQLIQEINRKMHLKIPLTSR